MSMPIIMLFVVMAICFIIRMPVSFSMLAASITYFLLQWNLQNHSLIFPRGVNGVDLIGIDDDQPASLQGILFFIEKKSQSAF